VPLRQGKGATQCVPNMEIEVPSLGVKEKSHERVTGAAVQMKRACKRRVNVSMRSEGIEDKVNS